MPLLLRPVLQPRDDSPNDYQINNKTVSCYFILESTWGPFFFKFFGLPPDETTYYPQLHNAAHRFL